MRRVIRDEDSKCTKITSGAPNKKVLASIVFLIYKYYGDED